VPDLFFHHSHHQRQPGFSHQMAHTFLEHSHDARQRQDHLDVGIRFRGEPAELGIPGKRERDSGMMPNGIPG
jgi:hypothetical protein